MKLIDMIHDGGFYLGHNHVRFADVIEEQHEGRILFKLVNPKKFKINDNVRGFLIVDKKLKEKEIILDNTKVYEFTDSEDYVEYNEISDDLSTCLFMTIKNENDEYFYARVDDINLCITKQE